MLGAVLHQHWTAKHWTAKPEVAAAETELRVSDEEEQQLLDMLHVVEANVVGSGEAK